MKRNFIRTAVFILILVILLGSVPAGAATVITVHDINIMVNNRIFQPVDVNGDPVRVFAYNGTTYAPLRALAEAYGLGVGYDANRNLAYVYDGEEPDLSSIDLSDASEFQFSASGGSTQLVVTPINIVVKGEIFKPTDVTGKSVPVFASNGTTYAPLRALAEAYGLEVGYNAERNLAYVTRPGEKAAFTKQADGSTFIAPEIDQLENDGTLVQSPVTFFSRTTKPYLSDEEQDNVDYISDAAAQAYVDLLVNEFGYVVNAADFKYNETWRLLMPGSGTDPGEYNIYNDVKVKHYCDSDYHNNTLEVTINNTNFRFADLGYRYTGDDVEAWSGERATDSYVLKDGYYLNASDEVLSVPAGERDKSTYSYTEPYASEFYTYACINGLCRLIVNGSELESHSALLCDFNNFNSSKNDMLIVWNEDGTDLLKLRWEENTFEGGEAYNLGDLLFDVYGDVDIDYNGKLYTIDSVDALTVRPMWLDRTGATESLVYFYIEIGDGNGGKALTLEGLVAAPFNLAEDSEWTRSGGSSTPAGSDPDDYNPNVADFARLDCLTCRGDGDCNSCGGSGNDYFGGYRTTCNTCHGSGNCRSCGGSGKR